MNEAAEGTAAPSGRETVAAFLLHLRSRGITEHRLLSAFEDVPRRNFVPVIHVTEAYAKGQMPIECGQIMTSADMVAKLLAALEVGEDHRVLELGTGTGYQSALLAKLAARVMTVERFYTLHDKAKTRLEQLGISNVISMRADGSVANVEFGMSDRIIANCAFTELPRHFLDNLSPGGVMIAPVGPADGIQMMKKFTKVGVRFEVSDLFTVRWQPFLPGVSEAI